MYSVQIEFQMFRKLDIVIKSSSVFKLSLVYKLMLLVLAPLTPPPDIIVTQVDDIVNWHCRVHDRCFPLKTTETTYTMYSGHQSTPLCLPPWMAQGDWTCGT